MSTEETAVGILREVLREDGDPIEEEAFEKFLAYRSGKTSLDTGVAHADLGVSGHYQDLLVIAQYCLNYIQEHGLDDFEKFLMIYSVHDIMLKVLAERKPPLTSKLTDLEPYALRIVKYIIRKLRKQDRNSQS